MGRQTILPKYDFAQHAQSANPKVCHSTPTVVLLEGILVLFPPRIRELLDMKVFLHVDDDTRLSRRCLEKARGPQAQSLEFILDQYIRFVKPAFTDYALPVSPFLLSASGGVYVHASDDESFTYLNIHLLLPSSSTDKELCRYHRSHWR